MTMTALRLAAKVAAWLASVPELEPGGPSDKDTEGILGRPGVVFRFCVRWGDGARRWPGSSLQGHTGQSCRSQAVHKPGVGAGGGVWWVRRHGLRAAQPGNWRRRAW